MEEIAPFLVRIPRIAALRAQEVVAERLGGLTNRVYRLDAGAQKLVLRVPGEGTAAYIDRKVEAHNARVAAAAGVSAEVLFFDETDGLMLTRFLEGCVTMSPQLFKERSGAPARAALALKRMHDCGREFRFRFELFKMIEDYRALLARLGAELPPGYETAVEQAEEVRRALAVRPPALKPCHCDPLTENFLDDGEKMWIVDWEYSGMNDPTWDLGDLAVEAGFDEVQEDELLQAYCGAPPPPELRARVIIHKAMCDLLWTLWGLIQHANGNNAEDFWVYALNRFDRCRSLMGQANFPRHLVVAAGG